MAWGKLISSNPNVPDIKLIGEVVLDKRKPPITDSTTQRDKLSSPHCKLFQKENKPFIEDMKSRNGTFVNGEKLQVGVPRQLLPNDSITLSWPSITYPKYDQNRHFAFTFQLETRRKQRPVSKFDQKKKLVSSKRGISVVSGTGRAFTTQQSMEAPEDFVGQLRFKPGSATLEKLQQAIKNNDEEWLLSFLGIGGLSVLLRELEIRFKKARMNNLDKLISYHVVKVIHEIMQYPKGFKAIIETPNALGIISLGLTSDHVKLQAFIPMLLAAVACLSTQGHKEVIESMNYFQKQKNERARFKTLVASLKTEDDVEYKTNVLRLINAIISKHENLEQRMAMRQEFKALGVLDIMEGLRYDDDRSLNEEMDVFEEEMNEDSKEAMVNNVDLSDPVAIAQALATQTHGKALQNYTEVMQLLFSIPVGTVEGVGTWALVEDVVRSATATETKKAPKKLDFQTIRTMKKQSRPGDLLQQDQIALREELSSLQKQIKQTKLSHLEEVNQMIDQHKKEKKELQISLEKEIVSLRDRLEAANKPTIDIPLTSNQPESQEQRNEEKQAELPPQVIGGPPPPPPPAGLAPPPLPGLGGGKQSFENEYPYHPTVQMKKFYWQQVRKHELPETIWEKIDFTSVNYLEPIELEKLFGAKKKAEAKKKVESVENPYENMIDLKRANNIGIMLKHFKLAPSIIKKAIIDIDETILTPEKISQLYRNAPTLDEVQLLSQFDGDARELGKSEQFLLQMVSIPDVTERLELLHFRNNFDDESEDLIHHYSTVTKGVQQILSSDLLDEVCELLLAVGNFLNYTKWKAPTSGFKMEFLTKVGDTRTTDNSLNILHYLTGLIADKKPNLLNISEELDFIGTASTIPVAKLHADFAEMNNRVSQIKRLLKKELDEEGMATAERFKEVMLSFSLQAKRKLETISKLKTELQQLTEKLQKLYPFSSSLPVEESLSIFSEFLLRFTKSHKENEEEQANREMKERMAKKREERERAQKEKKKQSRPSKPKNGLMDGAFATIRGGGMKTLRGKRGQSSFLGSLEELEAAFNTPQKSETETPLNVDVPELVYKEEPVNIPEETVNVPEEVLPPQKEELETLIEPEVDTADLLEDMLNNNEL